APRPPAVLHLRPEREEPSPLEQGFTVEDVERAFLCKGQEGGGDQRRHGASLALCVSYLLHSAMRSRTSRSNRSAASRIPKTLRDLNRYTVNRPTVSRSTSPQHHRQSRCIDAEGWLSPVACITCET